jgi:hypothetical protein
MKRRFAALDATTLVFPSGFDMLDDHVDTLDNHTLTIGDDTHDLAGLALVFSSCDDDFVVFS